MENIVAKGEIACFEQFLVLSVFKKLSAAEASESVYMRERVKTIEGGVLSLLHKAHG